MPAAAAVIHEHHKHGSKSSTSFTLVACPAGKLTSVRTLGHKLVSGGSVPAHTMAPAAVRAAEFLEQATPTILVRGDGRLYDVADMARVVSAALTDMRRKGKDAAAIERTRQAMESPLWMEDIKSAYVEFWNLLVGAWLDVNLSKQREQKELPLEWGGSRLTARTTFEIKSRNATRVRLELVSVAEGANANRALARLLWASGEDASGHQTMERVYRAAVDLQPETMRPNFAQSTKRLTIRDAENTREYFETHRIWLRWLSAGQADAYCSRKTGRAKDGAEG